MRPNIFIVMYNRVAIIRHYDDITTFSFGGSKKEEYESLPNIWPAGYFSTFGFHLITHMPQKKLTLPKNPLKE